MSYKLEQTFILQNSHFFFLMDGRQHFSSYSVNLYLDSRLLDVGYLVEK